MTKNIGKYISENVSGKYSQKILIMLNSSAIDAFKTVSKWVI